NVPFFSITGDNRVTAPSVFVLKSQEENSLVACLAKDFYPKNLEIYMNSTKDSSRLDKVSTKLTAQGKYNAVLVTNLESNNVQCQAKHQEKWVTNMETASKLKERSNTLAFIVIGIRVLFTKAIVFNMIMTAKLLAL
ncbi:hypothetical protein GDO78_013814, partial [Eleutherodactylus coqui]